MVSFESGIEQRVSPAEASEMLRVLGADFEPIRSSLLEYGLELTLAGELLKSRSDLSARTAAGSAARFLAITRMADLLACAGVDLPENCEALTADWRKARVDDVEGVA